MLFAIAVVCILILDQAMKYWTILNLVPDTGSQALFPGVVELVNVHNTGAAFGLLADGRWFFIALTAVFIVVVIVLLSRDIITGKLARFSLLAIMAGGIGNCIDRVMNGYVVDMFHLQFVDFAVFNVADIFVTVFGIIFCICLVAGKTVDKEEASAVLRPAKPDKRESSRVDYISQLKKPVVEGKEAIENEMAARKAAADSAVQFAAGEDFAAWNTPQEMAKEPAPAPAEPAPFVNPFEAAAPKRPEAPAPRTGRPAAPTPLSEAPARQAAPAPAPAAPSTKTTAFDDPFKAAAKAPAKDGDFNLEDIIAEFKD